MKRLKYYLITIFFLLSLKIGFAQTQELRIDPVNAYGSTVTQMFSSIRYIPLETNKNSQVGNIDRLEITTDNLIIMDKNTNSIFIFNRDGKFQSRISFSKLKSDKVIYFTLNRWKKQIIIETSLSKKYLVYGYDGKKITEIAKGEQNLTRYKFIQPDKQVSFNSPRKQASGTDYFISQYQNFNQVLDRMLPYVTSSINYDVNDALMANDYFNYYGLDASLLFSKSYDYNIYSVSPSAVQKKYALIFPSSYAIPKDFESNNNYSGKRIKYFFDNKNKIYALTNLYEIQGKLVFRIKTLNSGDKNVDLVYSLKTGVLTAFQKILPDNLNFKLPITSGMNFLSNGIMACDGKSLFASVSSRELFKARDRDKDLKISYNKGLLKYFAENNEESNPVIIEMQLK